jgi:hypothetical protein
MQITSHLLMVRPVNFAFNPETAVNNTFQVPSSEEDIQANALREFDRLVQVLRGNGVDVTVLEDTPEPNTPDSLFPNNWISFHQNGTVCLYPMFAENRRQERDPRVVELLKNRFKIHKVIDFSFYETDRHYLEGTGSMVLDRDERIAYACLSPRTDEKVLRDFGKTMGYKCITFNSVDGSGKAIYHTNVMMCVAEKYVVINLNTIHDRDERDKVVETIKDSKKELIKISDEQMNQFAGNMLQIENTAGEKLIIMSTQAFESLDQDQVRKISRYNRIIHSPLNTIERNGGGSARCMIAEIHLPEK